MNNEAVNLASSSGGGGDGRRCHRGHNLRLLPPFCLPPLLFSVPLPGPECQAAQEGSSAPVSRHGERGGEREEPALASVSRQSPAGTLAPQVHANEGGPINIPAILHREAHWDPSRHLRGWEGSGGGGAAGVEGRWGVFKFSSPQQGEAQV